MAKFIFYLVALVVAVWVGLQVEFDPGYLLFAYDTWTIEMPLWFAAVVALLFFILLHHFLQAWSLISHFTARFQSWLLQRARNRSRHQTQNGLLALAEGEWQAAENDLVKSVAHSDSPLINFLSAARAAQQQSAYQRRNEYLRMAAVVMPDAEVAIGLTQAELQLQHNQLEQALATLNHLRQVMPQHTYILKMLKDVYIRLSDWYSLIELIPLLRRRKVIQREESDALLQHAYKACLLSELEHEKNHHSILKHYRHLPRTVRNSGEIVSLFVKQLIVIEQEDEAAKLIEESMKSHWHTDLLDLYSRLVNSNLVKRLNKVEAWLNSRANNPNLLMAAARLSLHRQLWGKAKHYLEAVLQQQENPSAYLLLGQLLQQSGQIGKACDCYHKGLSMSVE